MRSLLLKIREVPPTLDTYRTSIDEAYECAVHQYSCRDNMKRVWDAYITFKVNQLNSSSTTNAISTQMCNELVDLLLRAMLAIPAATSIPENKNAIWKDYHFQNKVFNFNYIILFFRVNSVFTQRLISPIWAIYISIRTPFLFACTF